MGGSLAQQAWFCPVWDLRISSSLGFFLDLLLANSHSGHQPLPDEKLFWNLFTRWYWFYHIHAEIWHFWCCYLCNLGLEWHCWHGHPPALLLTLLSPTSPKPLSVPPVSLSVWHRAPLPLMWPGSPSQHSFCNHPLPLLLPESSISLGPGSDICLQAFASPSYFSPFGLCLSWCTLGLPSGNCPHQWR